MQNLDFQNEQLPVAEDLNQAQTDKDIAIKKRFLDGRSWGIVHANAWPSGLVVPISTANPSPNFADQISEFSVSFDTLLGLINIGQGSLSTDLPRKIGGLAYDLNGERIAILNDAAFNFSNTTPQGLGNSGNLQIPLTLSGTSGGSGTANPSVYGTYYLWIQYLQINDPNYEITLENGTITYPHLLDGYKIILTGSPVAPAGDGVSVFLCKVVWVQAFPETLLVTQGTASSSNGNLVSTIPVTTGDPGRNYSLIRSKGVEAIIDPNNPTSIYGVNELQTLFDHVNALGHGSVTANNPHATGITDIPGAGSEPIALSNQNVSLNKGIVDKTINATTGQSNVPQNSPPYPSTALFPSVGAGTLTPANLDATALSQQGQGSSGISSTAQAAWVRIAQLLASQYAYVQGVQLTQVYPTLRQTLDHLGDSSITSTPGTGDGWVGFSNSGTVDPVGMYRIFGSLASLSTGQQVLLLQKQYLPNFPTVPAEFPNNLTLATVYWDGTQLAQTPTDVSGSEPNDVRSLGLVGPQQLSTQLKASADQGALSQQNLQNYCADPDYLLAVPGFGVTELQMGAGSVISSGAAQTATGDPTMAQAPVGAITGRIWTTNSGTGLSSSFVFHQLANLRPSQRYGISFYYKASTTFNPRFRVGMVDGANTTPNPLMSLDGVTPLQPVDINLLNDGNWHRASFVVVALATVNPNNATQSKYLEFMFEQAAASIASGATLTITNIMVTEGEWIPGYQPGRMVTSGANLFYDDGRTTCPPGFVENTNIRGRLPIGWNPSGTNGIQTPGTQLGTAANNGSTLLQHDHAVAVINVQGGSSQAAFYNATDATNNAQGFTPAEVGIWCRAI